VNANLTDNADLKNTATYPPTNVLNLVRFAERALRARELSIIALFANVHKITSEIQQLSAAQSATETLTAQLENQLASMEFARILVTVLAVLMLTATSVD
jgi:hypothetical protein